MRALQETDGKMGLKDKFAWLRTMLKPLDTMGLREFTGNAYREKARQGFPTNFAPK